MTRQQIINDSDTPLTIHGVAGRLTHRTIRPGKPGLWCHQRWISEPRKVASRGNENAQIRAEIRFDDECGNGHNSFAITGEIRRPGARDCDSCGCIHDEIAKHFPELAHLIKWHLTSSDGPMHYIANTLYHAGDRDCNGRRKGERYHVKGCEEKRVVFGDFPISFKFGSGFVAFIEGAADWTKVEPVEVPHEPDERTNYKFEPKVTLTGHACRWHECPFDRREEAEEFLSACRAFAPKVVIYQDKFTRVGEGKERELDFARSSAVWPEATDAELMVEPDQLRAVLEARHPALVADFRKAMESAGLLWAPSELPG